MVLVLVLVLVSWFIEKQSENPAISSQRYATTLNLEEDDYSDDDYSYEEDEEYEDDEEYEEEGDSKATSFLFDKMFLFIEKNCIYLFQRRETELLD